MSIASTPIMCIDKTLRCHHVELYDVSDGTGAEAAAAAATNGAMLHSNEFNDNIIIESAELCQIVIAVCRFAILANLKAGTAIFHWIYESLFCLSVCVCVCVQLCVWRN